MLKRPTKKAAPAAFFCFRLQTPRSVIKDLAEEEFCPVILRLVEE